MNTQTIMQDNSLFHFSKSFRNGLVAALVLGLALLVSACGEEDISAQAASAKAGLPLNFSEDFSDNSAGWTLDTEWEIGVATAHIPTYDPPFSSDPGTDVTGLGDNGVAGVVLGGEYDVSATHGYYYLTSPVVNASNVSGTLDFGYFRWLNSDYPSFVTNIVEVFDGVTWVILWQQPNDGLFINESSWTFYNFDITPYANANLQVRFGFNIGGIGAGDAGGWNLDDVSIVEL